MLGKFFHTFENNEVARQGVILEQPSAGLYLVQYFDWIMGAPSTQELISITDMKGWRFYDSADAMNFEYKYVIGPREELKLKAADQDTAPV